MTVHVLHAGDGYSYLTRQVASGDQPRKAGESLADYYAHEGNPPGRWIGAGMTGVGVSGQVGEDQMRALFGEGLHPDAERIVAERVQGGASMDDASAAVRLGRRFPRFAKVEDQADWRAKVSGAYASFKTEHGRSPEVGTERDLIRWTIAGQMLATKLGRSPEDGERSAFVAQVGRQQRQPVAGYDLVFTPVKSVSTLWALGDDDVRSAVARAHEAAWRGAFGWIEQEAGVTRTGAGGVAQVDARGLMAAAFDHADSRTGDPNLHTHVAVSNKVQGSDGKWRALDARVLHALGVAGSERYNALVEEELGQRLGVSFVAESRGRGRQPVREVAGIDKDVRQAFSSRRAAIEETYEELLGDYRATHGYEPATKAQLRLAQQATLATREGKEEGVSLNERRGQWRATAVGVLGSEAGVDAMVARAITREGPRSDVEVDEQDLAQRVVTQVASKRATWGPWHLMAEALRQVREHPTAEPVATVAQRVADRAQVLSISLDPPELNPVPAPLQRGDGASVYTVHGAQRFTSRAVLEAEDEVVQAALRPGGLRVNETDLSAALVEVEHETGRALDEGQREMAAAFATSGREVVAGIGPAGAGKTTAMQAFTRAVEQAGGRVVALAPSAAAATVLGDELGVQGETLHKLIHDHSSGQVSQGLGIDPKTVLLVDEAGMAGTPQLAQVVRLARDHGASVRLLGDPQQLAAVGAGGVLRLVDERVGAVQLRQVHRFHDPAEAGASLQMRDGHTQGLDFYLEGDRVRGGSREAMIEEVFAAWQADNKAGHDVVMIAGTNDDATALSTQARRERVEAGQVEPGGVVLDDGTQAGRGDRIVTRRNNRTLGTANGKDFVKNGDTWTVLDRDNSGRLRARHDDHGGTITLPAAYVAAHVQLAYAGTVHRVQGRTTDRGHALVDASSTDRSSLYTAATRGRDNNRLYVVSDQPADVAGHAHPTPAVSPGEGLHQVLARDGAAVSATSAQQRAWQDAHSLQRLVPEMHDARQRLMPQRDEQLAATVAGALGPARAEQVTSDPAWHRVAAGLAAHQDAGTDLAGALGKVREPAEKEMKQQPSSPAQVLYRYVPPQAGNEEWVPLPTTPAGDDQVRSWAQRHSELIEQRIDHLTDQAATSQAAWISEDLTQPQHSDQAATAWAAAARQVVAYRDQYAITGADPLGPPPQAPEQRIDYDRAITGVIAMRQANHTDNDQAPQPEPVAAMTALERVRQNAAQRRGEGEQTGTSRERMRRAREELRRRQQQAKQAKPASIALPPQQPGPEPRGPSL